jgi:hypothetical protein
MSQLANLVILVHLGYFVFVMGGFVALLIGCARREAWVLNPWFRLSHFLAVALVLVEDVLQVECPLNVAQARLQSAGGLQGQGDVAGLLDWLLHGTISELTLDALYWSMGGVSLLLLILLPPRRRNRLRHPL